MTSFRTNALSLTALAYVPAVLSMMPVGVIVPFLPTLGIDLSASPGALGLAIALFSIPSAVLALLGGGLIDVYGVRRSMIVAASVAAAGSLIASYCQSLLAFDLAMLVCGVGFAGVCVGAPCLVVATMTGGTRVRAMSFVSTFAPTGYAAGLLLALPFVAAGDWPMALRIHAAMLASVAVVSAFLLPRVAATGSTRPGSARRTLPQLFSIAREPRALRLAVAVALPNALSYGTSLAAPSYLARVHELSITTSSATVAFAKLAAMVIGGLSMGYLLSRAVKPSLLYGTMAGIGALAQVLLFLPASGITVATGALILWLFAFGGMAGGAMTLLPGVVGDPARTGAGSGLVNQFISLASFVAPSTWLSLRDGRAFIALALGCLLVAFVALPRAEALPQRAPAR